MGREAMRRLCEDSKRTERTCMSLRKQESIEGIEGIERIVWTESRESRGLCGQNRADRR